ncbi:hypothetical protein THAOC_34004, partial [Thalassiosira oceanica]
DLRGPRSVRGGNKQRRREAVASRHHGRLRRPNRTSNSRVRFRGRVVYGQQGIDTGEPAGSYRGLRRRTTGSVSPRVREGDGAHRRGGGRGRGSHYASSLRRNKEVYLPDPTRGG